MFHYYQKVGGEESWRPVPAAQLANVVSADAPMFVTVLAVNKLVEGLSAEDKSKLSYEGPFYVDWDGPDIATVLEKVKAFMGKLEALKFDLGMARWYVTGSKGFHCEIPIECFMEKLPKGGVPNLPNIYREMVYEHYVDTIDMRVYSQGRGRMWRQCGVKRENGKYKVQVTADEIKAMTAESYLTACSKPRSTFPANTPALCIDLSISYSRAQQKVEDTMKARKSRKRDPKAKEKATCDSINFMMNGLGLKPGIGFHQIAMQLAIAANTAGMTEEELVAACENLCESHESDGTRYNTPGKRREELVRMHRYTFDNPMYDFSIGAIKVLLTHTAPDLDGIVVETEDLKKEIEEAAEFKDSADPEDKTPDEYADVAGGVTLSKYGVWAATEEGGKRRICAVSFQDIHLLVSTDTGQIIAYEAMVLVNGRANGRQTIEMETFQSVVMFNRFCQKLGHQMQGAESHLRGLFMRFVELAKKKGRTLYIAKREGLDLFNIPNHEDKELREPFLVWADSKGVTLDPRLKGKKLEISYQGFPDPRGLFRTDLADAPKLFDWAKDPANLESLRVTLHNMFGCQKADVMSKMVGWYTACFYRALFHRAYGKFPLLHVNGAAGAGKTEMNKTMAHLFFYNQEPKTLTPQSTPFAIAQHMASSISIPLILDEYKPHEMSIDLHNKLKLLFRDAYNKREVMKGGGNRDSDDYRSLSHTELAAPMVFIAEAAEEEAAVAERVVLVTVVKPASSVSLKWLARYQAWDRNKQQMAILGAYLASEAINTTTVKSLQEEFDVIFEQARNRYMLTEADLKADLSEAALSEKQGAKERSVYNFTVARFGLLRFKKLVDAIFGAAEFADTFADLEEAIYTRMSDLQPATQAEWAKVIDVFSTMSYAVDADSPYALRSSTEYEMGQRAGRNVIEISMQACYLKYRGYFRSTGSKPLFSGLQSFLHSIKDSTALIEHGHGQLLDKPGVYTFDLDELTKLRIGAFK
jgi:hypothetical protein